jgi:hypothetical protein
MNPIRNLLEIIREECTLKTQVQACALKVELKIRLRKLQVGVRVSSSRDL